MSTPLSNYRLMASMALLTALLAPALSTGADDPARIVAALDTEYQAAVERNDWQVMDRILHPDFTLVLGNGTVVSRADLLDEARQGNIKFEKQAPAPREIMGTFLVS